MACRGVHFALRDHDTTRLLQAQNDSERLRIVQEEIEAAWDEEWLYQTDKAWDAIHRCLTDGELRFDNGDYPYSMCILGGRLLHTGDDYIISLKTPLQVQDVCKALENIDRGWFRKRYFHLPDDYSRTKSDDDFEYTWDWFNGMSEFFAKAAAAGRHVIFTVDQ